MVTRLAASQRLDNCPLPKDARPPSHASAAEQFNIWSSWLTWRSTERVFVAAPVSDAYAEEADNKWHTRVASGMWLLPSHALAHGARGVLQRIRHAHLH